MDTVIAAIMGSTIALGSSSDPRADAQVVFFNHESNSKNDEQVLFMSWEDVAVSVEFLFNVDALGSDRIIVTPPIGWTCEPIDCSLSLLEDTSDTIKLFAFRGF